MKKRYLLILIGILSILPIQSLLSQDTLGIPMRYMVEGSDTLFIDEIEPAYKRYKPKKFTKRKEWRKYYKLVYNFSKAYPYALLAREKMEEADIYLATHKLSNTEREQYLSNFQKELFRTLESPLRKLTISQGKILIRLIDRELGQSTFYIIKDYRGSFSAGFWQGIGKLFGYNLKRPYNKFGDDRDVEELVQIYQRGEFNGLYYSIFGEMPSRPAVSPKPEYDYPQIIGYSNRKR